jgi:SAM-dependent methyltransferase
MGLVRNVVKAAVPAVALKAYRRLKYDELIPVMVGRYCVGNGIEVGAGRNPYCPKDRTTFLDRNTGNRDATEDADIIADAWSIPRPDESFDFLLSSHVLEHMPNTIQTLNEWIRVLRPGGHMVTILPHAERTIDRFRAVTPLEHHIEDFERGVDDADRSHLEEMRAGWEKLPIDPSEPTFEEQWGADRWDWDFRMKHGVLHYHVWTQNEIVRLFQHLGLRIRFVAETVPERPDSFAVVASKV